MVSSPRQCPGVEGMVCNRFLPSKENNTPCLCVTCRGKSCNLDDRCEECHDGPDYRCKRVSEYMVKLSLQCEMCERQAKASSSSFSGFSCSMPVSLCQLPSPAGTGVVTTTPSFTACAATYLAAAPLVSSTLFVPPGDVNSMEPGRKWNHRGNGLRC